MAISIVMLNADIKRGEKVFNAYILVSIRFELLSVGWLARLGSAVLSLCSSVVNANEWGFASSRYGCTIGAKKKGVKFFFKFFFSWGVGARVWVIGCGCSGGGWGCGRAGWSGLRMGRAG